LCKEIGADCDQTYVPEYSSRADCSPGLLNGQMKMMKTFGKGIGALFPDCKDASRLQSAALDRQLSAWQRFGLKFHLLFCKWCRRYGKQIRFLHKASHQFGEPECSHSPQPLPQDARERILEKLKSQGK